MATSERFDSVVVGVVEAVNERGIKINGEWKNVSRFAVGRVSEGPDDHPSSDLEGSGRVWRS
jgi:hypothetical protein